MISVQEASVSVLSNLYKPQVTSISIREAVGRMLAENVHADRDLPPFHRVTMDGIAIKFESWKQGKRTFRIESTQAAGEPQAILQNPENAVEVMTGAMLPIGTDTVIRYEDLQMATPQATVLATQLEAWQSIHLQGQDAKKDEPLLSSGTLLSPAEIALLATVGKPSVKVYTCPKTALVASGDELVEIGATPLPHQIRRSNTYAVEAAMRTMYWPGEQFHLRDEKESLKKSMEIILEEHDVLILSGGVSQGKFDFIPEVLGEIGVKKIFHQVSQRPGKPFWFGTTAAGKTVFALPGNPVSTFMCFYRYIKPWFEKSLGIDDKPVWAVLAKDFSFAPRLTYFLQVMVRNENGKLVAYPDAGGGSGDFANLKKVDGFLELPAERSDFKAGDVFPFIAFRL
jgi:molybdopterin molybdotransferase